MLAISCALLVGCASKDASADEQVTQTPVVPVQETAPQVTESPATPQPTENTEVQLPDVLPMDFSFSSGAGAWETVLTVNQDGSFVGSYHDSEMGDTGADYPNGTVYVCEFSGRFDSVEQVDDTTYSMKLSEITTTDDAGIEWIEDGVRYISAEPYGMEGGEEFLFYLPQTPVAGLSEQFLSWWPGRYEDPQPDTLSYYGILNVTTGYGFFSYDN